VLFLNETVSYYLTLSKIKTIEFINSISEKMNIRISCNNSVFKQYSTYIPCHNFVRCDSGLFQHSITLHVNKKSTA